MLLEKTQPPKIRLPVRGAMRKKGETTFRTIPKLKIRLNTTHKKK